MVNKIQETWSKWGNLYKGRFYLDGLRVNQKTFDFAREEFMASNRPYKRVNKSVFAHKYTITITATDKGQ